MASAAAGLLISEEAPNFDSRITNMYDPNAEKADSSRGYISGRDMELPDSGAQYGQITCARIGLDAPVYWDDTDEILLYGVGQSLLSLPPGFGSAIILSAHNTTYFACLEGIAVDDVITFKTNYCTYEYKVTRVEVIGEKELGPIVTKAALDEGHEELIMYTCYPFYAISGRKTERLTVFADRISGMDVKWRDLD